VLTFHVHPGCLKQGLRRENRIHGYPLIKENLAPVLGAVSGFSIASIDAKLDALQKKIIKLASNKAYYDDVAEEIHRLRELKQNALLENANRDTQRK